MTTTRGRASATLLLDERVLVTDSDNHVNTQNTTDLHDILICSILVRKWKGTGC